MFFVSELKVKYNGYFTFESVIDSWGQWGAHSDKKHQGWHPCFF